MKAFNVIKIFILKYFKYHSSFEALDLNLAKITILVFCIIYTPAVHTNTLPGLNGVDLLGEGVEAGQ